MNRYKTQKKYKRSKARSYLKKYAKGRTSRVRRKRC